MRCSGKDKTFSTPEKCKNETNLKSRFYDFEVSFAVGVGGIKGHPLCPFVVLPEETETRAIRMERPYTFLIKISQNNVGPFFFFIPTHNNACVRV